MTKPEFYAGFAWAIPTAFAAAVHACRFEQGDVLYSDPAAYDPKSRSKLPTRFHVQVLDPPRTQRATATEGESQRFFANWESPVTFEFMDYEKRECLEAESTQGRLFNCLWHGEIGPLLDPDLGSPDRPYLLRDLATRAEEFGDAILAQSGERAVEETEKRAPAVKAHWFATAIDLSSDGSRSKRDAIVQVLAPLFEIESHAYTPRQLALEEAERFHPTLEILALRIASRDATKIEEALRDALYVGGKATGREAGRFNVARHGRLIAVG